MKVTNLLLTFGIPWLSVGMLCASCGQGPKGSHLEEAWDELNDPAIFGTFVGSDFRSIPNNGKLHQTAWSDDYWPTFKGGISHRWQYGIASHRYEDFLFPLLTEQQSLNLTPKQISWLSPVEKYDLAMGKADFPLTQDERARMLASVRNGEIPTWFGLCHGWAAAAISEAEPGPGARVLAPGGQAVTFYASDIRALMTKAYADARLNTKQLGTRCWEKEIKYDRLGRPILSECRDLNAGAFHLVIADQIVNKQKPFILDVSPGAEVWNQPVVSYSFDYRNYRRWRRLERYAFVRAPGTVYLVEVRMTLSYAAERAPSATVHGTKLKTVDYHYSLELNERHEIIGGEWHGANRPDFIWAFEVSPQGVQGGIDLTWVRNIRDLSLKENLPNEPENPSERPGPAEPGLPSEPGVPGTPGPGGSLVIEHVTIQFRGTTSMAQVWFNAEVASAPATLQVQVKYGERSVPAGRFAVEQSSRSIVRFDYEHSGATGFVFVLRDSQGRVVGTVERAIQ